MSILKKSSTTVPAAPGTTSNVTGRQVGEWIDESALLFTLFKDKLFSATRGDDKFELVGEHEHDDEGNTTTEHPLVKFVESVVLNNKRQGRAPTIPTGDRNSAIECLPWAFSQAVTTGIDNQGQRTTYKVPATTEQLEELLGEGKKGAERAAAAEKNAEVIVKFLADLPYGFLNYIADGDTGEFLVLNMRAQFDPINTGLSPETLFTRLAENRRKVSEQRQIQSMLRGRNGNRQFGVAPAPTNMPTITQ